MRQKLDSSNNSYEMIPSCQVRPNDPKYDFGVVKNTKPKAELQQWDWSFIYHAEFTFHARCVRITREYTWYSQWGPVLSPACSNYPKNSLCSRPVWSLRESKWTWKSTSTWPSLTLSPLRNGRRTSLPWTPRGFLPPTLMESFSHLTLACLHFYLFNFPKKRWKLLLSWFCTVQSCLQGCSLKACLRTQFGFIAVLRRLTTFGESNTQTSFLYWIYVFAHKSSVRKMSCYPFQYNCTFQCYVSMKTLISGNQ